jgi:hypothetical protein
MLEVLLIVSLISLPGVGVAAPATLVVHDHYRAKKKKRPDGRQRTLFLCAAVVGVLSVLSIQLSTDTDFSNDWAIGHGSFMITSFISFLVTVVIYWLSVAVRKKEPNQAPEPTRPFGPRGSS